MTTKQYPSTVEVPTVQPSQLPNLPGNGGITVTNDDPQYSADLSNYQTFPSNQTQTLGPHQSTIFGEGQPVWARVTPGQAGNPTSVELSVYPGSPSAPQGAVDIANEVTVNGTVDVGTISGTVDANITNASIPVSGSVDANITNATLQIAGTVDIAAGQVVEVTNESGGSLTVAGTVDISSVGGTVTVDANGSDVTVDAVGVGALLGTIPVNVTSAQFTVAAGVNSLIITPITEVPVITVTVSINVSGTTVYLPTAETVNSDGSKSVVCQTLVPGTYTVTLSQLSNVPVYVFTSTGIQDVRAAITDPLVKPTVYPNGQTFLQRYALLGNAENVVTEIFSTSIATNPYMYWYRDHDAGTLLIWAPVTVTSVVDLSGASWPFRLVAIGGGYYVYAVPLAPAGSFPTQAAAPSHLFTINFSSTSSSPVAAAHIQGTPFLPKLPVQTFSIGTIAASTGSFGLPYPARLKKIYGQLTTGSVAGTRYATLGFADYIGTFTISTAATASQTVWFVGQPGPMPSGSSPGYNPASNSLITYFNFPDYGLLPEGWSLAFNIAGYQSGDQLENVTVWLEPA